MKNKLLHKLSQEVSTTLVGKLWWNLKDVFLSKRVNQLRVLIVNSVGCLGKINVMVFIEWFCVLSSPVTATY